MRKYIIQRYCRGWYQIAACEDDNIVEEIMRIDLWAKMCDSDFRIVLKSDHNQVVHETKLHRQVKIQFDWKQDGF